MNQSQITRAKTKIIKQIMSIVNPMLWESGFVDSEHPTGHLHICAHKRDDGYKIPNPMTYNEYVFGFTSRGEVIVDNWYMICTKDMKTFPIEDLFKIQKIAEKHYKPEHMKG